MGKRARERAVVSLLLYLLCAIINSMCELVHVTGKDICCAFWWIFTSSADAKSRYIYWIFNGIYFCKYNTARRCTFGIQFIVIWITYIHPDENYKYYTIFYTFSTNDYCEGRGRRNEPFSRSRVRKWKRTKIYVTLWNFRNPRYYEHNGAKLPSSRTKR